jgi:hypothetical protein
MQGRDSLQLASGSFRHISADDMVALDPIGDRRVVLDQRDMRRPLESGSERPLSPHQASFTPTEANTVSLF